MKPGPAPQPTALKLVKGNPGKRALPKNEPAPPPARPTAPDWMPPLARDEWEVMVERLAAVGLMTNLDTATLAVYCVNWARWVTAEQALERFGAADLSTHGYIMKTPKGYPMQNPLIAIANTASDLMMKAAAQFGMSPSSRSRLDVHVGSPVAPTGGQEGGKPAQTGTRGYFD